MCFSQTCATVNIKRIVRFGGIIHNGRGCRVGKLVTGTDNKVLESIIGIQVRVEKATVFGPASMRRTSHELIGSVLKNIFYLERFAKKLNREFVYKAEIMEREPVLEIRIRDFYVKAMAFLSDVNGGFEPGLVAFLVNLLFYSVFDKLPRGRVLFVFHETASDFHRYFHTCGKPSILLSNFCGEGSDIIALRIFKFKKIVIFFENSLKDEILEIKSRTLSKI
jgi:hypothetical protein